MGWGVVLMKHWWLTTGTSEGVASWVNKKLCLLLRGVGKRQKEILWKHMVIKKKQYANNISKGSEIFGGWVYTNIHKTLVAVLALLVKASNAESIGNSSCSCAFCCYTIMELSYNETKKSKLNMEQSAWNVHDGHTNDDNNDNNFQFSSCLGMVAITCCAVHILAQCQYGHLS